MSAIPLLGSLFGQIYHCTPKTGLIMPVPKVDLHQQLRTVPLEIIFELWGPKWPPRPKKSKRKCEKSEFLFQFWPQEHPGKTWEKTNCLGNFRPFLPWKVVLQVYAFIYYTIACHFSFPFFVGFMTYNKNIKIFWLRDHTWGKVPGIRILNNGLQSLEFCYKALKKPWKSLELFIKNRVATLIRYRRVFNIWTFSVLIFISLLSCHFTHKFWGEIKFS